jgi:hypothetical protein
MKYESVFTCLSGPCCWRGLSCEVRKFAAECSRLGRRIRMLCRAARIKSWAGGWFKEQPDDGPLTRPKHVVVYCIVLYITQ